MREEIDTLTRRWPCFVWGTWEGEASVSSSVTSRTEFWWDPKQPDVPMLWDSKIELGWDFFNEIIRRPVAAYIETHQHEVDEDGQGPRRSRLS